MKKPLVWSIMTDFERQLPYYYTIIGNYYEQEHIKRTHGYPSFQWLQCRCGRGELILENNKKFIIEPGRGMLLFPNEPHEYHALEPGWQVDLIVFTGTQIEDFIRRILKAERSTVYDVASPQTLSGRLEELYMLAGTSPATKELTCSALTYAFLVELSRLCSSGQSSPMVRLGDKLSPVFSYIAQNVDKQISLHALAELVGLTPQYFCSLFKKATSQTPVEYINLIKLRHAKALLLQTELPVREIAHRVGVEDPSYFCALFKRYEHMTPMSFRTLHG